MDPPRVFLIFTNRLVCEAVNALLRREGIDLLGMETDPETAMAQLRTLNPNVVLVEDNGTGSEQGTVSALVRATDGQDHLRIIRLCLADRELHIYHQEQRRLINTQDLVAAIRAA